MLEAKELVCVENWKWGTSLFKKVAQKIANTLKNLRRHCCEESDRARQAKLDELSVMQQRDPQTVSQLLAQMRESQDKVNSLSDAREFHDPENCGQLWSVPRYQSTLNKSELQNCASRDSGLPPETLNMMGISDVLNDYLLEKDNLEISRKITEFGIFFSWSETKTYGTYDDSRIEEETWATRLIQFEKHSPLWRWNFTSYWWTYSHVGVMEYPRFPISELHLAKFPDSMEFESWKVNFKTEVCAKTANPQITMSWITEVEKAQSIWRIEYIAINSWENRYPRLWNAGCNDSVCIEEDSQLAHSILEKNMCRRATCSKIRPILTRTTDFVHDLWAFSCTQSLMSKISMSDGIRHNYQQMNHFRIRSWKDCRSQN